MKKIVVTTLFFLLPVLATAAETADDLAYAQVRAIEITADEIEMVSPLEFHAKGNVVISGHGDEIHAHTAIITEDRHMITIEAEEFLLKN
ncbi:MAG: hypothetical protein ACTJHW_04510 [Paenalcaligenes sp.]